MARNREKANLMFNRWTSMKDDMGGTPRDRRPYLASECKVLTEAERFRREIIRDISRKVTEIQNAGLGEARIRDLNDEINKLMREKGHWEKQIVALDGPNYAKTAPKMFDGDGRHAPGKGGYAYYGAAKDLPGVRDVYAAASSEKKRRTRGEILANVTPDYYGYRDEDDGVLLAAEAEPERAAIAEAVREFEASRHATKRARIEAAGVAGSVAAATAEALGALAGGESEGEGEEEEDLEEEAAALHSAAFKAHVPLPSQQDIERMLLEKRKQLLLAKYATPDAMEEVTSTGGAGSS